MLYTLPNQTRSYVHDWVVEGENYCQWEDAFLPALFLAQHDDSIRRALVNVARLDPSTEIDAWIIAPPPAIDGAGTPPSNLVRAIVCLSRNAKFRIP